MTSIIESINSLFSSSESEQKARKLRASTSCYENKTIELDSDIIKKLEKIINNNQLASFGRIQLINLHNLKAKLSDTWPKMYNSIIEDLNREIASRTNNEDVYFARNEEEHLIVFSNKSHDQASLTCAKITQVLTTKYLGSVNPDKLLVNEAVSSPNGDLVFKTVALGELIERVLVVENDNDTSRNIGAYTNALSSTDKNKEPYYTVYKPVWDVRNEAVSTYMAVACSGTQSKVTKYRYQILTYAHDRQKKIAMDYKVLDEAIEALGELFKNDRRAILSIPLSYEIFFGSASMKAFFDQCKTIPQIYRPYISFLLIDFPNGVPFTKLDFVVGNLQQTSRIMAIELKEIPRDISMYKKCGIKCISLIAEPNGGKEYLDRLMHFEELCKSARIYLSLDQVNSKETFITATAANVDYISGEMIGTYIEEPKQMLHLSFEEILEQTR